MRAATDAFAERGLGVEMREIAERAGVAVGTIYRHFPSKEDLIAAIARTMLDEAAQGIRAAQAIADPIDGLSTLVACNLAGVARFGWLSEVFHGGEFPRHRLQELHGEMEGRGFRRRFQPLLERGIDQGRLRPDLDLAIAAAMLEGATAPWSSAGVLQGRDAPAAADAIMRTFLQGAACAPAHIPTKD